MVVETRSAPAGGYSREYYLSRGGPTFWAELRHLMGLAAVEEGERVLELGCGGGDFLSACAEKRPSLLVGLDVNREATSLARRLAPTGIITLADAASLPFADGAFDAIVAQHFIEHFERPDEVLRECWRVLAPGGLVAVATPNAMYPDPALFDDPTHRRIYSRAVLIAVFQRNGFRVERCYSLIPYLGHRRLTRGAARWFLGLRFLPYFRERGLTLLLRARKK